MSADFSAWNNANFTTKFTVTAKRTGDGQVKVLIAGTNGAQDMRVLNQGDPAEKFQALAPPHSFTGTVRWDDDDSITLKKLKLNSDVLASVIGGVVLVKIEA